MRVLLLAQGNGLRWDVPGALNDPTEKEHPFLGKPKHFVVIDGETVLDRARRLFKERGCEVILIAPNDDRYGERITLDNPFPTKTNEDKLLATKELWNKDGLTIIAFADCYYSEDAIDKIVSHKGEQFHMFRRPWASAITGHRWDETFAVSFGASDHERILKHCHRIVELVKTKRIKKDHMRTLYASLLGHSDLHEKVSPRELFTTPGQTIIDDWTDDFDSPLEWTNFVGRYYEHKTNVSICAPWRYGSGLREAARMFVQDFYGGKIIYGTAEGETFNRSAARNAAANKAFENPDCQVVFFVDTDTIVPLHQMWAAAYLANQTGELVIAYTHYYRMKRDRTADLLRSGTIPHLPGRLVIKHASGALAIPRSLWKAIGGYDERFESWGGEDRSFYHACCAYVNKNNSLRVWGDAYHLFHEVTPERNIARKDYQFNLDLGMRYKIAAGRYEATGVLRAIGDGIDIMPDKEAMMKILNEEGAPLNNQNPIGKIVYPGDYRGEYAYNLNKKGRTIGRKQNHINQIGAI